MGRKLARDFFLQDTVTVARALLGCVLWRRLDDGELLAARIVETEAYLGANDMASHARRGLRSERNASMYLEGGHAYVYFTYGMHWCMNVVTNEADIAEAVLLRGAEPLRGIEAMRLRRPKAKREWELMNGPGKICMAMEIDRKLDGESLRGDRLWITAPERGSARNRSEPSRRHRQLRRRRGVAAALLHPGKPQRVGIPECLRRSRNKPPLPATAGRGLG